MANEQQTGGSGAQAAQLVQQGQMNLQDHNQLNQAKRRARNIQQADGYTAVDLCGRAGWSPTQAADFLGIPLGTVQDWLHSYHTRGLHALEGMPDFQYTNQAGGGAAG